MVYMYGILHCDIPHCISLDKLETPADSNSNLTVVFFFPILLHKTAVDQYCCLIPVILVLHFAHRDKFFSKIKLV